MRNHLLIKPDWYQEYKSERDAAEGREKDIDAASLSEQLAELRDIYSLDADGNPHIRITGPLSNEGPDTYDVWLGYGGTAYPDIRDSVARAMSETGPEKTIHLDLDTPGGSVFGVDETYQDIFLASEDRKVIANVFGMATSAGYYLASAANEINAVSPASMVGSIGVAILAADFTKAYQNAGIEIINFTNTESPDKRPNLATDDGRAVIRKELDDLFDVFASRVIQGRAEQVSTFTRDTITNLRGATILAGEALEIGLIDAVQDKTKPAANAAQTSDLKEAFMSLDKILAENPELQAEFDAKIEAAKTPNTEPVVETDPEPEPAAIDTGLAIKVLKSPDYPEQMKNLAAKVIDGSMDAHAFGGSVAAFDTAIEAQKSAVATAQAAAIPATPAASLNEGPSESGKVEKPADIEATIERLAHF